MPPQPDQTSARLAETSFRAALAKAGVCNPQNIFLKNDALPADPGKDHLPALVIGGHVAGTFWGMKIGGQICRSRRAARAMPRRRRRRPQSRPGDRDAGFRGPRRRGGRCCPMAGFTFWINFNRRRNRLRRLHARESPHLGSPLLSRQQSAHLTNAPRYMANPELRLRSWPPARTSRSTTPNAPPSRIIPRPISIPKPSASSCVSMRSRRPSRRSMRVCCPLSSRSKRRCGRRQG